MFKLIILKTFTYTSILIIVDVIISGFDFNNHFTLVLFSFLVSFITSTVGPLIKFLTLPLNNFTFFIFNVAFIGLLAYFFELFIGGFNLDNGQIGPYSSTYIEVPEIKFILLANLIISGFLISFLNLLVEWCIAD